MAAAHSSTECNKLTTNNIATSFLSASFVHQIPSAPYAELYCKTPNKEEKKKKKTKKKKEKEDKEDKEEETEEEAEEDVICNETIWWGCDSPYSSPPLFSPSSRFLWLAKLATLCPLR